MEKMINVDGKEMRMVANGATPRIYRMMFGKDVFADITGAIKDGQIVDVSALEQLTFILGRQGGSIPDDKDIDEWLGELDDPMALVHAAGDVLTLWAGNRTSLSESKKKKGR